MKLITQLDDVAFLRQCNRIRHAVEEFVSETDVLSIRKRMPKLTGNEPEAVRKAAYEKQSRANISAMLDRLLEEKPEETLKVARLMVVLEDGDEMPNGFDLIMILLDVLGDQRVLSFFYRLAKSGLMNTAD